MKKRISALLLALVMTFSLMAPMATAQESVAAVKEAVYLGVKDFTALNVSGNKVKEVDFVHRFFVNGEVAEYTIATGAEEEYAIQNELMEGYIYNVTADGTVVTDVELLEGDAIQMGTVASVGELGSKPVYEITTPVGGAVVTKIAAGDLAADDTVKVTANAVYKAFVAEEYTSPVEYTPGLKTLKNFLAASMQPVGTALYVFGAGWDWEDGETANTAMTIGLPQSWIDFFQQQDSSYHYKKKTNGSTSLSYYTSTGGWNQYYYAGLDCSGYVGWTVYNTLHTEDTTVDQSEGYVCSSTNQAKMLADLGLGTYDRGAQKMNPDGTIYKDGDGDTHRIFATTDFKIGDIFSDNGHAWICLGTCADGSMVFMHSTPSTSIDGAGEGGGVQISALDVEGREDCMAIQLADHYMDYYPEWCERYDAVIRGSSFIDVWDGGVPGEQGYSEKKAGKFSWDIENVLTDPDGYATMTPTEILGDLFNDDFVPTVAGGEGDSTVGTDYKGEAVYLGLENFTKYDDDDEATFIHRFFAGDKVLTFTIGGAEENFPIQNTLMEGYIYNIVAEDGVVASAALQDKGTIKMGKVADLKGEFGEKPVYEITQAVGGSSVAAIEASALQDTDTVKVTANAVYKAFVAEEYTAPVDGAAGVTTLRNFLTTALEPVGTAVYVYGGTWDWQDDVSSNQSMTIGIPQSWIDFFQAQDTTYHYKQTDASGSYAKSYYTSNRGWNQYYYAGVDCSAYTGWIVYNVTNIDNNTVVNNEEGYVGSSTKQAYNLAAKGWGTWNHDTAALAAAGELKPGDVVSMSGHVWVVVGMCDDGSVVFMHSTPSDSRDGYAGGGIQIASLNPNGQDQTDCEAYKLADYYMSKYYPQWYERYAISQKSYSSYLQTYTGTGTAGKYAGVFSWDLSGASVMTDPDGFADMKPAEILAAIFGESEDVVKTTEAVYMGLKYFTEYSKDDEATFVHQFAIDGVATDFIVACDDPFEVQNQLMEGYIYNVTTTNGDITAVELLDKGVIEMGKVADMGDLSGKPVYEITQAVGGSTVTAIEASALQATDTVKVTENAVYKTFVAEEYTAPVAGTPGLKTLKNFITTALQPVGTAVYVYGGAWDWQDDLSSNQSMTIGLPQSWVDFFQAQDQSYHYKQKDADGNYALSYYTSNRGWNQYYYAGVDCSAYTGWIVYNVTNTENNTDNTAGHVGSSTKQAKTFANYGWGTWEHDTAAVAAAGKLKVGDVVSMSGHVWVVLGVCNDGSVVFMHSTPSTARDGYGEGGGIQIASLNPNGQSDTACEAYALADYYMSKYYPQWYERYAISQKSYSSYLQTYTSGTAGTWGGVFSWDLTGKGLLTDPEGYAKMSPAQILSDIFNDEGPVSKLTLTYPEGIEKDEVKVEVYKGFPTSSSQTIQQMVSSGRLTEIPANEDGTYSIAESGTYSYHISGEGYYNILKLFNVKGADIAAGTKTIELTGGKLGTGDDLYDDGFQPTSKPSQAPDTYKMDARDAMLCIWPDEILNGAFNIENTTHEAGSYNTPAFQGDDALHQVTTQDELVAFMADRDASCNYMYGYSAGTTPNYGFDIPMAIFTNTAIPEGATLEEAAALVKANGKTTVWYQTQIHPNEPASGEAALVIIDRFINDPETKALLDDINVVIVPRINPDGSYLFSRATYDGFDMNRDHMSLKAAELAQLHTVYRLFMAEVVLDGHEFTFYGAGGSYDAGYMSNADDVQSTPATSMNNDPAVTAIALQMAGEAFQDATDAGLRIYHYGTTVNNPIGRAYFGLFDCLSFLIETRGIGAGRTNFERRVFSQETVIMSYIEGTAERAEEIKQTVAESRARTIAKGEVYDEDDLLYIYQTASGKTLTDYTIDRYQYAMDGSLYKVTEDVTLKLNDTAERTRVRPTAYVIPADAENIEKILYIMDNQGAEYYELEAGSRAKLEQYYYIGAYKAANGRNVGIEAGLRDEATVWFKNGAYVFPMDQVAADVIAMTIEPDVTDSNGYDGTLYQYGIVSYDAETMNFPLYRYTKDYARETLVSNARTQGGEAEPSIRDEAEVVAPEAPAATFVDVPATHWANAAVEAVAKAGLFNGTSATTFSPDAATTRGQLMTVLARLSGAKAATIEEGVAWAVANNVSDGSASGAQITREQLVTMLYRYAGSPAVTGDLSAYADAASVSAWAKDAMTWAVQQGIITGMTQTTLAPAGTATRAQVATIMQRYAGL